MKLITRFELAEKSDQDVYGLLRHCFNELAKSDPERAERRNALASIENISREIAERYIS